MTSIPSSSAQKMADMEKVVQLDAGNRGISAFTLPPGELERAAASLYRLRGTTETLAIVTGFPCLLDFDVPTETDGPLGAVAIARAFLAATAAENPNEPSPRVVLVTDDCNAGVTRAALEAVALVDRSRCSLEAFPPKSEWGQQQVEKEEAAEGATAMLNSSSSSSSSSASAGVRTRFNALAQSCATVVSIERAGPGADGAGCYTMRGNDMSHLLAPLHELMDKERLAKLRGNNNNPDATTATAASPVTPTMMGDDGSASSSSSLAVETVGIGDGGNEVGMGKVFEAILTSTVPQASKVACVVPADHLLVCGVSNWGGSALAAAVLLLRKNADDAAIVATSGVDDVDRGGSLLWSLGMPSDEEDTAVLKAMVRAGARDGCSRKLEATVDGLPFQASLDVTQQIKEVFFAP